MHIPERPETVEAEGLARYEAALRRLASAEERVDWMMDHGGRVDIRPLVRQSGKRKLGP